MISLKQIRYALAVEKHLHFRKAAEECAISQSALSTALSEMEAQLGFPIFERDTKKVIITPLGQAVLDKARTINTQVGDILKLKRHQDERLSGPLSIGMIPTIAPYLLPRILEPLLKAYPELNLSVVEEQSHILVDMVRKGELDTAVLALPYPLENLLNIKFWDENFYWVTHHDDALAHQNRITAKELHTTNLLLLSDGHCLKDHALAACKLPEKSAHSLAATSLHTLIQLVAAGLGSTLVPALGLKQLVENNEQLSAVPLAEKGPHRTLALIVRPNYPNFSDLDCLAQLFKQQLTEEET